MAASEMTSDERDLIYVEVPNFYAAVERADDPALRARAVVVGGNPEKRGKVMSASADAQEAGVIPGMAMRDAIDRCPHACVVATDMKRYRAVSVLLLAALRSRFESLEPSGMAAAFLDVTPMQLDADAMLQLGQALVEQVRVELGLPLQVGIGPSKLAARLAAEEAGEGEVLRIAAEQVSGFLASLSPDRLPEVGPKTLSVLRGLGIDSVGDLLALGPDRLERELGNHGRRIFAFAEGRDVTPLRTSAHAKSQSHEVTFARPESDLIALEERLQGLCQDAESRLRQGSLHARRITIKVRYPNAKTTTRTQTVARAVGGRAEIYDVARSLLERTDALQRAIDRLGLTLSQLSVASDPDPQLDLFSEPS